jgi:hypothetical protein
MPQRESSRLPPEIFATFSSKVRNFVVQTRVNDHLLVSSRTSPKYQRLEMNPQNHRSQLPAVELPASLLPVAPAPEKAAAPLTSDLMYQLAALTAGAFLLMTLL